MPLALYKHASAAKQATYHHPSKNQQARLLNDRNETPVVTNNSTNTTETTETTAKKNPGLLGFF